MTDFAQLHIAGKPVLEIPIDGSYAHQPDHFHPCSLEDAMPATAETPRRRRMRLFGGRMLERLTDPDRERPFLKLLFEVIAPMLLEQGIKYLPLLLAKLEAPEDPKTTA